MIFNKKQVFTLIICLNVVNMLGCHKFEKNNDPSPLDGYWKLLSLTSTDRYGVTTVTDLSSLYFPAEFYSENNGGYVESCVVSPIETKWQAGELNTLCYGPDQSVIKNMKLIYDDDKMVALREYFNGRKETVTYQRDTDLSNAQKGNAHGCHFRL